MRRVFSSLGFAVYSVVLALVIVEAVLRAYFAVRVDAGVLLWGTSWYREKVRAELLRGQDVFEHENEQPGYSKYFPHQRLTDVDGNGEPFAVRTNAHGFRGPEYSIEKRPGTFRVLTLGGSSTFGFTDRDDETYPHYLRVLLEEAHALGACPRVKAFEVINLGVPHLDTLQISHLFAREGAHLQPDVVTLYSGYNNTLGLGRSGWLKRLSRYSMSVNFIRVALNEKAYVTEELLRAQTPERQRAFMRGVQQLIERSEKGDFAFVPILQQMRTLSPSALREKPITYAQEIAGLEAELARVGKVSLLEGKMLIHNQLMMELTRLAERRSLRLLDARRALDEHRDLLATYVHLQPEANHRLARLLADEVIELCTSL